MGFYFKAMPNVRNTREISKQIFEGPAHPQMEIVDWGDVPVYFRQPLHALLYNYLVPVCSIFDFIFIFNSMFYLLILLLFL